MVNPSKLRTDEHEASLGSPGRDVGLRQGSEEPLQMIHGCHLRVFSKHKII